MPYPKVQQIAAKDTWSKKAYQAIVQNPFKKGHDPKRHVLTREERQKGFQRALESIADRYPEAISDKYQTHMTKFFYRWLQRKGRMNPDDVEVIRDKYKAPLDAAARQLISMFPGIVQTRLKSAESIKEKMGRKPVTLTTMTDIAGARVIFPTLQALYKGLERIRQSFKVIEEQDYISHPKGGYRSYHLLVLVQGLPIEVQLKTPRMLEWGKIGHSDFPVYKERERLKAKYGKKMGKLESYMQRMAEHYYLSDTGQKLKRPKAPVLWKKEGMPMFTLNPAITEESKRVFMMYAKDAINWAGSPPIGGNVGGTKEERGNLTQLKRAGLITTYRYDGMDWIVFTEKGQEYAASLGIDIPGRT